MEDTMEEKIPLEKVPDQLWICCPKCGGELTKDIKLFPQPGEDSLNAWHRLHYENYRQAKERGKRFCPECVIVEP